MLAKVIVHAPTRAEAAAALAATMAGARLHGVTTNRDLLVRTLRHPGFLAGETDTGFLDRHGLDHLAAPLADEEAVGRHAVAAALAGQARRRARAPVQPTIPSGFRNNPFAPQRVTFDGAARSVTVAYRFGRDGHTVSGVEVDGSAFALDGASVSPERVTLTTGGLTRGYLVDQVGSTVFVDGPDGSSTFEEHERLPAAGDQVSEGSALAPMPGGVVRVAVKEGDRVEAGQELVVLEAMKMEHAVHATSAGVVAAVNVIEGDQVETGRILVVIEGDDALDGDSGVEPSKGTAS
jgi:propionyl-CoA carboxylase alpha chain